MKYLYACLLFIVLLTGCVSDDFNNMAQGFTPITPTQAAVMALDQHNPDKRQAYPPLTPVALVTGRLLLPDRWRDDRAPI